MISVLISVNKIDTFISMKITKLLTILSGVCIRPCDNQSDEY
jgi:hypothetical protein